MGNLQELARESIPEDIQDAMEQLLVATGKGLKEIIIACSVPNWFNEEIIQALQAIVVVEGDPAELQNDILDYAFVRPYHNLGFVIHEDVRSILEQKMGTDFERAFSLHEGMLRFFEEKAERASEAEKGLYVRESGYHARKLGALYISHGDNESALNSLSLAIESYRTVGDLRNLLRTFRILGRLYLNLKEIGQAERAYLVAAKLAQDLKEAELYNELLEEIGDELAQRYLWDRALNIYSRAEDEEALAALYAAQADYLRDNQEEDAARKAYLRSKDIYLHLGDLVKANQISEAIRVLEEEQKQAKSRLAASPAQQLTSKASTQNQREESEIHQPVGEGTMHETLNIFISSTTKDLQPERDAVERAIAGLRLEAVRSEKVGSQSATSREICALMAQRCDIYLGILGRRYGYVLREGISATEFEFDTARKAGKPILLYRKRVPEMEAEQQALLERITPRANSTAPEVEAEQQALLERVSDFDTGYYIRSFDDNDVPDRLVEWVQVDLVQQITRIVRGEVPAVKPPAERVGEIVPSGRRTLIATLGRAPGTVTGLYHALKAVGKPVDRVFTISTADFPVKRAVRIVRREMETEGVIYDNTPLAAVDIASDRDVQEFKGAVYDLLATAGDDGDEICLGITGGRTVMGALLTMVAQLEAPEGTMLYQLSVPEDIWVEGQVPGFFRLSQERQREVLQPPDYHLVPVPFIRFASEEE